MKKITINDVAKYAGVSKKTISRVLNSEPNVSLDTKTKVHQAIKALGYQPNPQARALASNQSLLIGLLYASQSNSFVSKIQVGALKRCRADGYNLIIYPEDHESDLLLENLEKGLINTNLDGLILTPPFSDMKPLLSFLATRQIPFVRVGGDQSLNQHPSVYSNDKEASYEMCRYLISLGHQRIAFIVGHPDHAASQQRLLGYQQALEEASIKPIDDYIQQGFFTFESGEQCARKLLTLSPRPTAIFASNDYMATGIVKVAAQMNLFIPNDLTVTGFDNAPASRYIWPSLTTIKQPITEMAFEAARILIRIIRQKPIENPNVIFKDELIVRESSAPAPKVG